RRRDWRALSVVAASSSRSQRAAPSTCPAISSDGGGIVRASAAGMGSGAVVFVVIEVVFDMREGGADERFSAWKTTAGGAAPGQQFSGGGLKELGELLGHLRLDCAFPH